MTEPPKSRQAVGNSEIARGWDVQLHRSFTCAGRIVLVTVLPLRTEEGALRFISRWQPGPPLRMLPADIEAFDAGRRHCEGLIRDYVARLEST